MLTDFQNSFTDRFTSTYVVKMLLAILAHLKHVTTLLCETLMSEN